MSKYNNLVNKSEITNQDDDKSVRTSDRFVVFSYASPESSQRCNISAIKVRGCFETEENAKAHAKTLQAYDPNFDVWVMSMWKWCPFPPSYDNTEMSYEQQSEKLQELMTHINEEKSGRNQEFIDRMENLTNVSTTPYIA